MEHFDTVKFKGVEFYTHRYFFDTDHSLHLQYWFHLPSTETFFIDIPLPHGKHSEDDIKRIHDAVLSAFYEIYCLYYDPKCKKHEWVNSMAMSISSRSRICKKCGKVDVVDVDMTSSSAPDGSDFKIVDQFTNIWNKFHGGKHENKSGQT